MTPSVSAGNGGVSAWGGSRGGLAETVVKLQHMVLVVPQPGVVLLLGVAGRRKLCLGWY